MAEQKSKFITRGWTTFSLLLLILAAFLLAGLDGLRRQELLSPYDTSRYLSDARQIHDRGGPPALVAMCFTGQYTHDFNMPLYVGLLSLLPCDSPQVFAWARLLTLVLGAAGILVAFIVAQRLFGNSAALLTAALMALNSAYLSYSTIVGCEVLFVAFIVLAWFAMARYLEGRSRFAWIGLWVALAYLTKGNGIFVAPVALGAAWFKERGRILRSKQVWLGIAIFLLVASPILTRNILRYGSPFRNLNSRVLWVDSWNEMYGPDVQEHPPTRTRYLQRHTLGQIGSRIAKGAFQEGMFLVVGTGQNYLLHDQLRLKVWPVGLMLIGLSLWGALDRRTRHAAIPAIGLGAVFFIFFTWFPVKDLRFDLPLAPIVLIFSARGVTCGYERLMRLKRGGFSFSAPTATIYLAGAIVIAGIGAATATLAACRTPLDICKFPPGYEQLLRWRRTQIASDKLLMMGPSHAYAYPWTPDFDGRQMPVPFVASMPELQAYIAKHGVSYVVVDFSTLEQRQAAFDGWMEIEARTVRVRRLPEGWRQVFPADQVAPAYIVFQVDASRTETESRSRRDTPLTPDRSE